MNPTTLKEQYTPGNTARAAQFMAARELDTHGFFLAPLLQPGFDVLDAGCGPGTITAGIAQAAFPGRVTGTDISTEQLDRGHRLTQGREIMNLGFVHASAYEMPFADHSFDVVFSHALLEHLRDPARAIAEFHRVLRPGGFIALCSPDWNAFELAPHSMRVGRAIHAYQHLQERKGARTDAGARLPQLLSQAGFTLLAHNEWMEEDEDTSGTAREMARQLDNAGQFHHATTLREWAADPAARLRQSWKYATAVRADEYKAHHRVWE